MLVLIALRKLDSHLCRCPIEYTLYIFNSSYGGMAWQRLHDPSHLLLALILLKLHFVDDAPDSFHIDLHLITICHESLGVHEQTNTAWRTRQDCSTSSERCASAEMLYDLSNSEDHVVGSSFLPLFSVDLGPVLQLLRIPNNILARNTRPYGRELVK